MGTGIDYFEAPKQLQRIGDSAFRGCKSLCVAKLNDGLKVIGSNSFCESSLREVCIPGTVTEIGENALNSSNHVIVFLAKDYQIDLK